MTKTSVLARTVSSTGTPMAFAVHSSTRAFLSVQTACTHYGDARRGGDANDSQAPSTTHNHPGVLICPEGKVKRVGCPRRRDSRRIPVSS